MSPNELIQLLSTVDFDPKTEIEIDLNITIDDQSFEIFEHNLYLEDVKLENPPGHVKLIIQGNAVKKEAE